LSQSPLWLFFLCWQGQKKVLMLTTSQRSTLPPVAVTGIGSLPFHDPHAAVRQGPLTISISTSGSAPALAVRLRQQLEREFGPEYAVLLSLLRELRETVAKRYPNAQERRNLWYQLLDSDLLELLRAGHYDLAQQLIALLIGDDAISATPFTTRREVDGD
jgi:hypothetical protein